MATYSSILAWRIPLDRGAGSPALQADSLPNFPKAIIFEILNIGFSFHWLVCGFSSSTALTYARICISLYQFSYYWFAENWPLQYSKYKILNLIFIQAHLKMVTIIQSTQFDFLIVCAGLWFCPVFKGRNTLHCTLYDLHIQ